ncbi:MAG: lysylphosphatidylglycerol synthase transmembrane domain-containing protein, partial [Luteitalea sp.]
FLVSSFVGSFLPAGVGGDAARAYALGRRTAQRGAALASVAVDRILGVVAIALMGAIGVAIYARAHPDPQVQAVATVSAAAVVVGSAALCWADRWLRWLPAAWHGWTPVRLPLRLADGIAAYRATPRTLASVFALSLLVQLLRIVQAYGLGFALGMTVPFSYYLVFMPIGLLMLLLPLSVSGFGLPQGVMIWLLRPLGVPDPQSLALTTLIVLSGLVGNLPGAWLYLRPSPDHAADGPVGKL